MTESHAYAFHDGPDEFAVPQEPVAEETVEAFHDLEDRSPGSTRAEAVEMVGGKDERPWYRKPSSLWYVLFSRRALKTSG